MFPEPRRCTDLLVSVVSACFVLPLSDNNCREAFFFFPGAWCLLQLRFNECIDWPSPEFFACVVNNAAVLFLASWAVHESAQIPKHELFLCTRSFIVLYRQRSLCSKCKHERHSHLCLYIYSYFLGTCVIGNAPVYASANALAFFDIVYVFLPSKQRIFCTRCKHQRHRHLCLYMYF